MSALQQAFESRDVPAFCRIARELMASHPSDDELDELDELCTSRGVVGAPSCTQRFQQSVRTLREMVGEKVIGQEIFLLFLFLP